MNKKLLSLPLVMLLAVGMVQGATLINHWTFDDGSGTSATDAVGGDHGTLMGDPTWTTGFVGGAIYLDGSGDWVSTPEQFDWSSEPFSYSVWINPESVSGWRPILGPSLNKGPSFALRNGLTRLSKLGQFTVGDGGSINTNEWTHVAVTFDSNGDYHHYIDGMEVSMGNRVSLFDQRTLQIGTYRSGSKYFHGAIDDVRVYNGILSAAEVLQIYNDAQLPPDNTTPTVPQNLISPFQTETVINISWDASSDPESGVANYKVYRDGGLVGSPVGTNFMDIGLTQNTAYTYEVSAVNGAGLESARSSALVASTLADTLAPTIVSVNATRTTVHVVWSEQMDPVTAGNPATYNIPGVTITGGYLLGDGKTAFLNTADSSEFTVTATGAEDLAGNTAPDSETYNLLGCFI